MVTKCVKLKQRQWVWVWSKTQVTFSWQSVMSFFWWSSMLHSSHCQHCPGIISIAPKYLLSIKDWSTCRLGHIFTGSTNGDDKACNSQIYCQHNFTAPLRILLQCSTRPALHQIRKTKKAEDEVIVKWSLTLTTLLPDIYGAVSWKPASFRIIWRNKMCYNPSLNSTGSQTCMRSQTYN